MIYNSPDPHLKTVLLRYLLKHMPQSKQLHSMLRGVALFEASKGVAALAGMLGLLGLLHHNLHHLALELIGHFGLDPRQPFPVMLLSWADRLNATPFKTIWLIASLYAFTRWVEAWGLWHDRAWGEWFGALSGALYIPFELRHIAHHASWHNVFIFLINVLLVAFLMYRLWQRKSAQEL